MPAYRERVYLCPAEDGKPGWILDFPVWWDRRRFLALYGQRCIDTGNPTYLDYGMLLTKSEALAWDRQCREGFAEDPRSRSASLAEGMKQWDAKLGSARWVIVESYEWESGLD